VVVFHYDGVRAIVLEHRLGVVPTEVVSGQDGAVRAAELESCPNVQNLLYDADRRIEVEWAGPKYSVYPVKLTLFTEDRQGLLADVTSVISGVRSNIQNIEARTGDNRAIIDVTVDIVDLQHLEKIVSSLRKIDGVYQVERVMGPGPHG